MTEEDWQDLDRQIRAYEKTRPHVPIDVKPGAKVIFHAEGGYVPERELAKQTLSVGAVYVVASAEVGGWVTNLKLEGIQGSFNSAMFSPAPPPETETP